MSGAKISEGTCSACGGRDEIFEAKGGTLSTKCTQCGHHGFIKSPAGVARVRAKLGAPAPANPWSLDITKL